MAALMANGRRDVVPRARDPGVALMEPGATVSRLRAAFDAGHTRPAAWRRRQLAAFARLVREGGRELTDAMRRDLGKPPVESWVTEIGFVAREIDGLAKHLDAWMRPRRVPVPWVLLPATARIEPQPLGVTLVISPWYYPVQLLILPMATAVAAGNAVVGKPSELAPATSAVIARLAARYLDASAVAIVEGGPPETTALLAQRFDHIFYTGGGRVGRIVMEAAAKHLTPVTLELGGKSPAIVAADADVETAARRIAYGKFINAGQTCVAPDYVLAAPAIEERLVHALERQLRTAYGPDPRASRSFGRIVNDRHFARLKGLLDAGGYASVALGGETDAADRYIAPTILRGVSPDAAVMSEEIFGPILPVLTVADVDEAIRFVNAGPKPLALYVFSRSNRVARHVLARTSSGSACVNTCVVQLAVPALPFGGVGESGMGSYHGRAGFDAFSHGRAIFRRAPGPEPPLQYPPYTRLREVILRLIL
jgi:aldehyde dehydrogenase (NAD+)